MESFEEEPNKLSTQEKALMVNLDKHKYGTFAEIGAGQEVARFFFQAGGANGTVAKSISAYDMAYSTAMYGECQRYVCEDRLSQMLDAEWEMMKETISGTRPDETTYFVFSNTVAAKSYTYNRDYNGWLGIKLQVNPLGEANTVMLHVRMLDEDRLLQAQALGLVGVNLIHSTFYHYKEPYELISHLSDNIETKRIEIDYIKFDGPDFKHIDNRLMCLKLVQEKLTYGVMFDPDQEVVQPSEALYKKSVLVERGSFRPITKVNVDMLECALTQFKQESVVESADVLPLMEITLRNLMSEGDVDLEDFLARIDLLSSLGYNVLISNFKEYYRLNNYLLRLNAKNVGMVIGIKNLQEIFKEDYYLDLEGGILEAFGKLFSRNMKMYVYPAYSEDMKNLITGDNFKPPFQLRLLYDFLLNQNHLESLRGVSTEYLEIFSRDILKMIDDNEDHEGDWRGQLPPGVSEIIEENELFGFKKKSK